MRRKSIVAQLQVPLQHVVRPVNRDIRSRERVIYMTMADTAREGAVSS
jgi:hypothetical protein